MRDLDDLTGLLEQLTDAASFSEAGECLIAWARELTGCRTALLRFTEEGEEQSWAPLCLHQGADERFARDETLVASAECICGRVATGAVDTSQPFFTEHGSFVWSSVGTITQEFTPLELGPVRGRCIAEGYQSVAAFPLMGPNGPIGCLHVADPKPGRFQGSEQTVEAACRLAGRIILRHQASEREHALLEAIQAALLPSTPAQSAHLEVGVCFASATDAARIGGDFYDIIELGRGRTLVLVGDYSGRGVESAGLAARARYTLATLARDTTTPAALFAAANRVLRDSLPPTRFVTAVACLFEAGCTTVRVALAGHPAPIVLGPEGTREVEGPHSLPLGTMPDTDYRDFQFTLPPEDVLLLYTDGVSEARRGESLFGLEGITQAWRDAHPCGLERLTCAICEASGAFRDPDLPSDDRLVLALRTRPTPDARG